MRTQARSLASLGGLRIRRCCEPWCRSQTATAPIGPLAWEPPCAMCAAHKRQKKQKKQKKKGTHFLLPKLLLLYCSFGIFNLGTQIIHPVTQVGNLDSFYGFMPSTCYRIRYHCSLRTKLIQVVERKVAFNWNASNLGSWWAQQPPKPPLEVKGFKGEQGSNLS